MSAQEASGSTQQAETLLEQYQDVRGRSERYCAPLAIEDYGLQAMAETSPAKWHLAHTSWFFETFLLKPFLADYNPLNTQFEYLFNSYYNGIGQQFPRAQRGLLSRPTVQEIYDYRRAIDDAMLQLLGSNATPGSCFHFTTVRQPPPLLQNSVLSAHYVKRTHFLRLSEKAQVS